MKNIFPSIILFSLLLYFLTSINYQSRGQERLNLYGGIGIPEQWVVGPRIQFNQVQLGVGVGISDYQTSISGDITYHFGGRSQMSVRRPWYIKGGLSNWMAHEEQIENHLGIYFRTGRDINFSKKLGLNTEFGILTGDLANELILGTNSKVIPCLGIFLFYRI